MIYLDTGCLLKLYYPEPNSGAVAAAAAGQQIVFSALHELEIVTAFQLKRFRGEATEEQTRRAMHLVRHDLAMGKLEPLSVDWPKVILNAAHLAQTHTAASGCRSLDLLHCALASEIEPVFFVSTDRRQIAVANEIGLRVQTV